MPQDRGIDQVVVQHRIGPREDFGRAERDQPRIARPGADEIDFTFCHSFQNNLMPADPPPSLLMTPDLRRRLQQRYEEAAAAGGTGSRPDFARIHDLLAECVRADPGNILYLDALLANLRRREARTGQAVVAKVAAKGSCAVKAKPRAQGQVLSTQH